MRTILLTVTISATLSFSNCKSKNSSPTNTNTTSTSTPDNTTISGPSSRTSDNGAGHITCKLDGKDWTNDNAIATQTGTSFLNIASDEDQKEAISLIVNHPATGTFDLNHGVSGSYTDASGTSYGSMDGSGNLTITNYTPPSDKGYGKVEGNFSGTFSLDPTKKHTVSDGKFTMPVKKL